MAALEQNLFQEFSICLKGQHLAQFMNFMMQTHFNKFNSAKVEAGFEG